MLGSLPDDGNVWALPCEESERVGDCTSHLEQTAAAVVTNNAESVVAVAVDNTNVNAVQTNAVQPPTHLVHSSPNGRLNLICFFPAFLGRG